MREVTSFLKMLDEVYGVFGLDYTMALSTRPESYLGEPPTHQHSPVSSQRRLPLLLHQTCHALAASRSRLPSPCVYPRTAAGTHMLQVSWSSGTRLRLRCRRPWMHQAGSGCSTQRMEHSMAQRLTSQVMRPQQPHNHTAQLPRQLVCTLSTAVRRLSHRTFLEVRALPHRHTRVCFDSLHVFALLGLSCSV